MAIFWVIKYITYHTQSFRKRSCKNVLLYSPRKNKPGTIPVKFVGFLRAALSKMAGLHYIKPELIDLQFWTKLPLKFSAVKHYDKSLVRFFFNVTSLKCLLKYLPFSKIGGTQTWGLENPGGGYGGGNYCWNDVRTSWHHWPPRAVSNSIACSRDHRSSKYCPGHSSRQFRTFGCLWSRLWNLFKNGNRKSIPRQKIPHGTHCRWRDFLLRTQDVGMFQSWKGRLFKDWKNVGSQNFTPFLIQRYFFKN